MDIQEAWFRKSIARMVRPRMVVTPSGVVETATGGRYADLAANGARRASVQAALHVTSGTTGCGCTPVSRKPLTESVTTCQPCGSAPNPACATVPQLSHL